MIWDWFLDAFNPGPQLVNIERVSPKPRQRIDREIREHKNWRGEVLRREYRDVHYSLHHTKGWKRTFTSPWTKM